MTGDTRKYPKGTPRKHHFVPRGYLAGFCAEGAERFALFDRARVAYRDRQQPAEVANIKDYYAYDMGGGQVHFNVEVALSKLESDALPVIKKIDAGDELTAEERYVLSLYSAFQHTRTPVFQHTVEGISTHIVKRIAQMMQAPTSAEAAAAHAPEEQREVTAAQMQDMAEHLKITVNRQASLQMMLKMAPDIADTLYGIDWIIARRPDEKTSFITTDSPFCLVPGPGHVQDGFSGIGLKTPGVMKVFPLSQSSVLVMTEPGYGMFDKRLTREEVRQTNEAVARQCQNFVFGRDMALIKRVVGDTGIDKAQWRSGWNFD